MCALWDDAAAAAAAAAAAEIACMSCCCCCSMSSYFGVKPFVGQVGQGLQINVLFAKPCLLS
jgi:hypothetical protein